MYYKIDKNNKIIDWYDDINKCNCNFYQDEDKHIEMIDYMNKNQVFAYIEDNKIVYKGCSISIDYTAQYKRELSDSDYKVIKALEKLLLSDTDLHKTRQALRDKINELEQTNNGG